VRSKGKTKKRVSRNHPGKSTDEDRMDEANVVGADKFTMEGALKRFLVTYAGAIAIGIVLTYLYVMMLVRTGHLVMVLLVVPLYAYIFADMVLWMRKGIRSVEVDSSGLTIHRINDGTPARIEADQITGVYVSRFLDRTTVNIVLKGGTVKTFLSIRRYTGPRIRMTNEPYDHNQFVDFVKRVTTLRRGNLSPH